MVFGNESQMQIEMNLLQMARSVNHNSSENSSSKESGSDTSLPLRSYSKWSPSEQGATLVWRDLCFYATHATDSSDIKRIINNASGAVQPGTLMAVMGSSGSGKTSLMSALAYRQPVGTIVRGDILINGRRIGPFMQRISGFVHQEDLFIGSLTVLEHLTFMAHLRLDRRVQRRERNAIIKDLLETTGLLSCAKTRIGSGDDGKVLSGGEKKRLAFATELLISPVIMFCDEPTSGLDSFSAQQLVQTLHNLSRRGTTVMCTIHQPSSQLFAMFDNLLLLADGRVAFTGSPANALEFFAEQGYICPESYNPADYLIGVLATDPCHQSASERIAHYMCDLFAVSTAAKQRDTLVNLEFHMAESANFPFDTEVDDFRGPRWFKSLFWICYRSTLAVLREPAIQTLRIVQKAALAVVIGLCFAGTINLSQLGVQAVQGAIFILISENTFHPMYSMLNRFPQQFPLFLREKRSGIYSTAQYYIAHVLAMLPGLIIEPLLFTAIAYWLIGLQPTFYASMMTTVCLILVMNISTATGCFFSIVFNSVPLAMAYLVPLDYIVMVTSGIFIKITTIPSVFYWIQYISWMMYAYEAMTILQWENVQNITCFEESPDLPCLHSGQDVLDKYSFSINDFNRNLFAMLFIYMSLHILSYIFLWRKARRI